MYRTDSECRVGLSESICRALKNEMAGAWLGRRFHCTALVRSCFQWSITAQTRRCGLLWPVTTWALHHNFLVTMKRKWWSRQRWWQTDGLQSLNVAGLTGCSRQCSLLFAFELSSMLDADTPYFFLLFLKVFGFPLYSVVFFGTLGSLLLATWAPLHSQCTPSRRFDRAQCCSNIYTLHLAVSVYNFGSSPWACNKRSACNG